MKKQERRHSLLKRVFGRPKSPATQPPRREPAPAKHALPVRTTSAPSKSVVKWLRAMPLNRPVPLQPSLNLTLALKRGYVVQTVLGHHYAMTKAGLAAGWPWVKDTFFRDDRQLWEGICAHGVGHPFAYDKTDKTAGIHGCCGHHCCS